VYYFRGAYKFNRAIPGCGRHRFKSLNGVRILMREVELKFLGVNVPDLTARIGELGAHKKFEGEVEAWFFDFDDGRLKKEKKTLRLRRLGDIGQLTLKEEISRSDEKEMEEDEVIVPDYGGLRQVLVRMGLKEYKSTIKYRVSYALKMPDEVHFDFDTYEGIPTFLEIEAQKKGIVRSYASKLGLPADSGKTWSVKELFEHYNVPFKKNGS